MMNIYIRLFLVLALASLLSACGGGGSGGSDGPTPPSMSNDPSLSGLSVSVGTLTPAFQTSTTNYEVQVDAAVTSIVVTSTSTHSKATVAVNGNAVTSGSASFPITLDVGNNTVTIVVTAENGTTTRTYTLSVYRPNSDAFLTNLSISTADLDQIFQSTLLNYTAAVAYVTTSVQVTAIAAQGASVSTNGNAVASGAASDPIDLAVGANTITITVTAEDGATNTTYTIVITRQSPPPFAIQSYIKASNTDAGDALGGNANYNDSINWQDHPIALSGDTLAVGAFGEDGCGTGINNAGESDNNCIHSGAVYIFTRDGAGVWSQQAYVKASRYAPGFSFGYSVALDGDTLAVGEHQEGVYIFNRDAAGIWSQTVVVKPCDGVTGMGFGDSVALSGDTLLVGAPADGRTFAGTATCPLSGMQGDNIAGGRVHIFTRDGAGVWSQQAYLRASNGESDDGFGESVALYNDTLAVSAVGEDGGFWGVNTDESNNLSANSGAVYVFTRDNAGGWSQQAYVKASSAEDSGGGGFGRSIALDGNTLSVGTGRIPTSQRYGNVHVLTRNNAGVWSYQSVLKPSAAYNKWVGYSVALSGDMLATGAITDESSATGINGDEDDVNGGADSGAAFVFSRDGAGVWSQQAYIKASNTDLGDRFGYAVALDGDTLAVTAPEEDSGATGVNGDQSDNSAPEAGAVYVFQ